MMRDLLRFCLSFVLLVGLSISAEAQPEPCECTNCPVPITDNGTFDGFLDVTVDGPNDLGACPLQQVCFTITHTWVGDLSASLISPSGLNYLVMADSDNNFGGCGNSNDNIDVCIDIGTGNPLTNNTDYICNGGAGNCLINNWTVPCGGVTDPVGGGVQAPTCNLNDFNVPGNPANGTWTLRVNDICGADVGFLQTWNMTFACGVINCETINCQANGGVLNQPDVSDCQGNPALNLNITPTYGAGDPAPPAGEYSYTFVVSQNGNIFNFITGPNLSTLPPGNYEVCGLSYLTTDAPDLPPFIGQPFVDFQNTITTSFDPICGDLSDDCFSVIIGPPIPPTFLDTLICLGDCYTTPTGVDCCGAGPCSYTLQSYLGCDSMVTVNVGLIFPDQTFIDTIVCLDECVVIDNVDYCPPGVYNLQYTNEQGCDSIVTLSVNAVPVQALIIPPGTIDCTTPAVVIDGSISIGTAWEWTDEDGMVLANTPFVVVNEAGCYTLTVSNTLFGVTCTDSETICVTSNAQLPGNLTITGPTTVCDGNIVVYTIIPDPDAFSYDWTFPSDATVVAGGDGSPTITIDWSGSMGGDVCVFGVNACGPGPETCSAVTVDPLPATPDINGPTNVCAGEIAVFTTTTDPNSSSYNWMVPPGVIIQSGQGTTTLTTQWPAGTTGQVCLVNSNSCGPSPETCVGVTVDPLPLVPNVTGPSPVCPGDMEVYSTPADPTATSFSWTVPSCGTIVSGQGTNSITVSWDGSCAGGDICVTATNACGDAGPDCLPVVVNSLPTQPSINGPDLSCLTDIETYSTISQAGETYTWTVTGGSIQSGQGTASIDVQWTSTGAGQVCVTATNSCGDSPQTCLDVTVEDVPVQPVISGLDIVCDGTITDYSVVADPDAIDYVWSSTCGSITSGQGTESITIDFAGCPGGATICVEVVNDCGNSPQTCFDVQGGTVPADPAINGPDVSCELAQDTYCATIDPNISTYTWTVSGGTITNGQGTECIDVDWTTSGTQQVCVTGSNGCGDSGQVCFDVEVGEVPVPPTIDGFDLPCLDDTETYTASSSDPSVIGFTWAVSCGQILSGQGTASITVLWDNSTGGPCEVCATADNDCGPGLPACLPITVVDYPVVDAGADDAVCALSYDLSAGPAAAAGSWSGSGPGIALFDDETAAATSVTVDTYGAYTFTWTESSVLGNCLSSDDVIITFNSDPTLVGAIQEDCTLDEQNYTVTFTIGGGEQPYTVVGNVPGVLTGDTFVSDLIASGTPYSFDITDVNGCGPVTVAGQETCDCFTDAGSLDVTPLTRCEDESVLIDLPLDLMLDPNDIFLFVLHTDNGTNGNSLGTILDQNTTGQFSFLVGTMNFGETYFVSVIAGNDDGMGGIDLADDCTDIAQGVPVVWYDYPQPIAGDNDDACGLTYTLSATPDIGGSWFMSGGPGMATFVDVNDPNTDVTVTTFGFYTFVWTEDNNGCQDSDEVLIQFNDGPTAAVTSETCDVLNLNYSVSFEISGGLAPYTVVGAGVLTDTIFVSDPIPAGTSYNFEVTDANGCGPFLVTGLVDCPCTTDAGAMDQTMVSVCADELVTVPEATGTILDPEDIIVYVIHNGSGPELGTEVYAQNTLPTFGLIPPMLENTVYYISSVAGNDLDMDGNIDLDDPCVDVSIGTPVEWLSLPEVSFAGGDTVCEGETAEINVVVNSLECVTIEIQLLDGSMQTLTCLNDGDVVSIPTDITSGTVTILSIVDANGCVGTPGATADITVNLEPEATVTSTGTICNSTDSGMSTVFDFGTLVTGGDTGGDWVNTDNVPATGTFPSLDFTGVTPGVYTFTYTTASAQAPCEEASYTAEITVEDCECPELDLVPTASLCNDGGTIDLTDLEITTAIGTWSLIGTPPGATNPAVLTGTVLDATGADPGDYTVQFTLVDTPPVGCATMNEAIVTVSAVLSPGVPEAALEFCADEGSVVVLADLLTGEDTGGTWQETSTDPSVGGAFNPGVGTFTTGGQAAGTYTFRYTVTPDAPCDAADATVTVVINGLPIADAGLDFELTCFEESTTLGGASSIGPNISYLWTADSGSFPGDETSGTPVVSLPGVYTLTVTDESTGCIAIDQVEITADQEVPMPFISLSPVSCFGESDAAIIIDSIVGGQPPYLISFNGEPFVQTTTFFNLEAAVYTISVQDANGCETEELTINIEQPQDVNVELVALVEGDNIILLGDSLNLLAVTSIPEDSIDYIQWEPADLLSCDTCILTSANPLETTNFSVTIESNGCADSDNLTIAVRKERDVYVPNIFSPDGDGDNDVFYIFAGSTVARINAFLVFDRWGETVHSYYNFEPNNPAYGWDGNYRGVRLNPGVFVWYAEVEYIDGVIEILKGDVTLAR